jgi:hypothetical protein
MRHDLTVASSVRWSVKIAGWCCRGRLVTGVYGVSCVVGRTSEEGMSASNVDMAYD